MTNLSAALFYHIKQYLCIFNFWPWSTWLVHQRTWQEDCSPAPKQWQDAFSGLQKDSQSSYWHMSANRGLSIFPLPRENTMHHLNLLAQKKSLFTDFPEERKLPHDFASQFLHQRLFPSNVPKVDLKHLFDSVGLKSLPFPILTQILLVCLTWLVSVWKACLSKWSGNQFFYRTPWKRHWYQKSFAAREELSHSATKKLISVELLDFIYKGLKNCVRKNQWFL